MEMGATEGFMKAQIEQLKEENRKLKKDLEFVYGWKDQLEKENENLKEELFKIKRNTKYNWLKNTLVYDDSKTAIEQGARAYEAELHNRYVSELEEENKKLKEENEDLKAIVDHYKKFEEGKNKLKEVYIKNTAKFLDKKFPKINGFMEEDTLQELRDLGEI